MARIRPVDFEIVYKLNFDTVTRGHHMYKAVWSPEIGEKVECYEDTRKEAKDYDKHSVSIFKLSNKEGKKTLVRHIPVELSEQLQNTPHFEATPIKGLDTPGLLSRSHLYLDTGHLWI